MSGIGANQKRPLDGFYFYVTDRQLAEKSEVDRLLRQYGRMTYYKRLVLPYPIGVKVLYNVKLPLLCANQNYRYLLLKDQC